MRTKTINYDFIKIGSNEFDNFFSSVAIFQKSRFESKKKNLIWYCCAILKTQNRNCGSGIIGKKLK